jgi:hypothetical protein
MIRVMVWNIFAAVWLAYYSGRSLVLDHPQQSDAIVVLGGEWDDVRYWRGGELLHDAYVLVPQLMSHAALVGICWQ